MWKIFDGPTIYVLEPGAPGTLSGRMVGNVYEARTLLQQASRDPGNMRVLREARKELAGMGGARSESVNELIAALASDIAAGRLRVYQPDELGVRREGYAGSVPSDADEPDAEEYEELTDLSDLAEIDPAPPPEKDVSCQVKALEEASKAGAPFCQECS